MKKNLLWAAYAAAILLVWVSASFSQARQPAEDAPEQKPVMRVVRLYYANPATVAQTIASAMKPFTKLDRAVASASAELKTVILSGSEETVNIMEEMIRELDVPIDLPVLANMEITVDFIYATSSGRESQPPVRLEPVWKQLHANFHHQTYLLMDEIMLHSTERQGGSSSGSVRINSNEVQYKMSYKASSIIEDNKKKTVRFNDFTMSFQYPYYVKDEASPSKGHTELRMASFGSDIDVRVGQQIIFGKSGLPNGDAIIAVLSVKILDDK